MENSSMVLLPPSWGRLMTTLAVLALSVLAGCSSMGQDSFSGSPDFGAASGKWFVKQIAYPVAPRDLSPVDEIAGGTAAEIYENCVKALHTKKTESSRKMKDQL